MYGTYHNIIPYSVFVGGVMRECRDTLAALFL